MDFFNNLADKRRMRRLDTAFEHGQFNRLLPEAFAVRPVVRRHAADLLVRGGYDRVGELVRDACVDLCRQRTELWREKMPESTIEMVTRRGLDIQPSIDQWIAGKKERSKHLDHRIGFLSAIAVRIGERMVDLLLEKYVQISKENTQAQSEHYKTRKSGDYSSYEPPVEPWAGFELLGDIASSDVTILHKLATFYSQQNCGDAVRGLRYTEIIDEQIWAALSSSAAAGALWSIEAVGKSGDRRTIDVLERAAATSYLSEGAAAELAKALARCGGEQGGKLLEALLKKKDSMWGDKFIESVAEAIADVGYSAAIQSLSDELSRLTSDLGRYPDCMVKKDKHGSYRSSWEPTARSVGALTFALGRLGAPVVKDTILRILRHPIDTVQDWPSTWTITYNAWTLYQCALAASSYNDPTFVPPLKSILNNQHSIVRYGAVISLSKYCPAPYQGGFGPLLTDTDSLVREAAVRAQGKALSGSFDQRAIEAVIALMGDEKDSVRAAARAAVVNIGAGAVEVLKSHASNKNLRLRVGVLSCLSELADIKDTASLSGAGANGSAATIFVTSEMALTGDYGIALSVLRDVWQTNITKGALSRLVHLEFPVPGVGAEGASERSAVRRWVAALDSKFPNAPCLLTDQALASWLRLRLPQRKQDIVESQPTDEYSGSASRASLLLDLLDRARESAKEIGRGNARKQAKVEKKLVDRMVAQLQ